MDAQQSNAHPQQAYLGEMANGQPINQPYCDQWDFHIEIPDVARTWGNDLFFYVSFQSKTDSIAKLWAKPISEQM